MMRRWPAILAIAAIATLCGSPARAIAADEGGTSAKLQACASTIGKCGCTITKAGTYTVTADLSIMDGTTPLGDCLDVKAPHVTLFLNAHLINGEGTGVGLNVLSTATNFFIEGGSEAGGGALITHFSTGVTIEGANGTIEDFGSKHNTGAGVVLSRAHGVNLSNFAANANAIYGLWLLGSSNNQIHCGVMNANLALQGTATGLYLGCSASGPDGKKCHGIPGSNNNLLFNLAAGDSADATTGNTSYGIAIDLGNTGNFITGNQAYFNPTADLLDNNPGCGKNVWINNRFQTTAPGTNAGCLK